MSYTTLQARLPANVPGRFYVTDQCLDCDLCCDIAPMVFKRNDSSGAAFVFKQPVGETELLLALESLMGCPCDAIHADGDALVFHPNSLLPRSKKACSHCDASRADSV
ncbi:MAG: ferredoxin [Verrucomicrobiaceae bacterium]|nr:ferredoxin [Verrucomicrobiaceae bacterium]